LSPGGPRGGSCSPKSQERASGCCGLARYPRLARCVLSHIDAALMISEVGSISAVRRRDLFLCIKPSSTPRALTTVSVTYARTFEILSLWGNRAVTWFLRSSHCRFCGTGTIIVQEFPIRGMVDQSLTNNGFQADVSLKLSMSLSPYSYLQEHEHGTLELILRAPGSRGLASATPLDCIEILESSVSALSINTSPNLFNANRVKSCPAKCPSVYLLSLELP
jgi:hypothetical protein